jgi:phosphatidylethanolamine/phosphatidyl-N-methylethanolamine N-methyltransferase
MKDRLSLAERLEDEVRFFKTWATSPLKVGSVTPTSRQLANVMVALARPDLSGFVLETGPGTGVVTQALLDAGMPAERIVSIEYDKDFCRLLKKRFPDIHLIQGDALDLKNTLGEFRDVKFSTALSGIPLLNLPKKKRAPYLEGLLDHLVPGGVVSQLSYSFTPPQEAIPGRLAVDKSKWVTLNFPPGRAWIYRRP